MHTTDTDPILDHKLLDRRTEVEIARRIRAGTEPIETLVRANYKLAMSIATKLHRPHLTLTVEDLFQEGVLGLMRAAQLYNPDRGCRFSTYATPWVMCFVRNAIRDKSRVIRVPAHLEEQLIRISMGKDPLSPALAAARARTKNQRAATGANDRLAHARRAAGMRSVGDAEVMDRVPDSSAESRAERNEEETAMAHALECLDRRSALIVRLRFGLDGEGRRTMSEIGARLGITKERVRQIQNKALAELRERIEAGAGAGACLAS